MILLLILLLFIIIFYTYQAKWNPVRPDFYPIEEIVIIGHRGAPAMVLENTIESFTKAFESGIKGIELDVQLSKDGELVVFHDWCLGHITGSTNQIENMYYSDIQNYSHQNTFHIPLLGEVLEICPRDRFINIEIKSRNFLNTQLVKKVVQIVQQYSLEKSVVISSFNPFVLQFTKKLLPDLLTAYLWSSKDTSFLINSPMWIWMCQPDVFHIDINDINKNIISWIHKKKLAILTFTVNNSTDFSKAKELKLDGIFTDDPCLKLNSKTS